jgi:hypothetical protein
LPIKPALHRGLVSLVELEPIKGIKQLNEAVERSRLAFDPVKQGFGLMDFRNIDVIHALKLLHRERLGHGLLDRLIYQKLATPSAETVHGFPYPEAEQGVATAQVMVKER